MAETAATARMVEPVTPFPKPRSRKLAAVEPNLEDSNAPLLIRQNTLAMFPGLAGDDNVDDNDINKNPDAIDNESMEGFIDSDRNEGPSSISSDSLGRKQARTPSLASLASTTYPQNASGIEDALIDDEDALVERPRKISRNHSLVGPLFSSRQLKHTPSSLDLLTEPADTHVFDDDDVQIDQSNTMEDNGTNSSEINANDDSVFNIQQQQHQQDEVLENDEDDGDENTSCGDDEVHHAKTMGGGVATLDETGYEEDNDDGEKRRNILDDDDDDDDDEEEDAEDGKVEADPVRDVVAVGVATGASEASGLGPKSTVAAAFAAPANPQGKPGPAYSSAPMPEKPSPITRRESFKDASHSSWRVF